MCNFGAMGLSGAAFVSFVPSNAGKYSNFGGWETFWPPFGCVLGSIWAALASNGNLSRVKMVATSAQNLEKVDQNVHVDTASVFPSTFY